MMHGRTGLVTFPRASAENLHIYCYSVKNRVRHACSLRAGDSARISVARRSKVDQRV
jgi:hypothetical protein